MTVADRLALAVCRLIDPATGTCATGEICQRCRRDSAAVAHKLAAILGEGHSLSSVDAATRVSLLIAEIPAPGTMLVAADEVSPVEQEITGNGSGASLPPFSNEPRVWEPLPLWLVMARAEAKESGSDAYLPLNFSSRCIQAWAPVIEALGDWLLPDSEALPINELAAAQQHLRHALRARLLQQAQVARGAGPH